MEKKKAFKQSEASLFEGGNFTSTFNESEKSRLIYLYLIELRLKNMPTTSQAFQLKTYEPIENE